MAVIRSTNLLGQQRLDVVHLRGVESAICSDFDVLAGDILAGRSACIVHGFEVITVSAGIPATSVTVRTAGSAVLHPEASDSGTIFSVPSDRADEVLSSSNTRVTGGFTAASTNYVGIDLRRTADANTADLVQFLDPDTKTEKAKTVPLARTLDYVFVVSTQEFGSTPGIAPVAKVVTDAGNNVVSVEDARNFFCRLGKGGSATDPQHAYPWPGGRSEAGNNSDFTTGDKAIGSLKDWMDAAMTRLWELGGGEYWYSATADRNVRMIRLGSATVFSSTGDWFEWVGGANLHWRGIAVLFDNSTGHINEIKDQATSSAGLTDLANGECVYVDLDRTQNLTGGSALVAVKASLSTLGTPIVPGSRFIFAWRYGSYIYTRDGQFFVGVTQPVATTVAVGTVRLHATPGAPSTPTVVTIDANGGFVLTETAGSFNPAISVFGAAATGAAHAGRGLMATGGAAVTGQAGYGLVANGGAVSNASGTPGRGIVATGGAGFGAGSPGLGLLGIGGAPGATGPGGIGVGANGSPGGTGGQGGIALLATGGNAGTGSNNGGEGLLSYGGNATSGIGGRGATINGGNASAGVGGAGAVITAGTSAAGSVGAIGLSTFGGASTTVAAGDALIATGGTSTTGAAGKGAVVTGGNASSSGQGGTGLEVFGGASVSGVGGTALIVSAGAGASGGVAAKFKKSTTANSTVLTRVGQGVEISKATANPSNIDPALVFYSANAQVLNQFTHLGRQTGQLSCFHDDWMQTPAANPIWTVAATSGAASLALNNPATGYGGTYLSLTAVRGGGVDQWYYLRSGRASFPHPGANTSLYFQAEFIVSTNIAPDANTELWVGFTSVVTSTPTSPTAAGANTMAFRYLGGTDTTGRWYTYVRNAAAANAAQDTGASFGAVAIGTVPSQVLRIEVYGSATEVGAAIVFFYIDGAMVQSYTTNLPTGSMYMIATAGAITTNSTHTLYLGNVDASWNPIPITVR